jgi:hypothetical protein
LQSASKQTPTIRQKHNIHSKSLKKFNGRHSKIFQNVPVCIWISVSSLLNKAAFTSENFTEPIETVQETKHLKEPIFNRNKSLEK